MYTLKATDHNRMHTAIHFILIILFVLISTQAQADTTPDRTTKYTIEIDGYDSGVAELKWTRLKNGQTKLHSEENVELFGYKYTMNANFNWKQGKLAVFSIAEKDDGESNDVSGRVEGDEMSFFNNTTKTKSNTLKTADYDLSYVGLANYLAQKEFPQGILKVRVLDTATGEVAPSEITVKEHEKLTYDGVSFNCKKINYTTTGMEATIWITEDKFGPFVVKEVTKLDEGIIIQELKSYSLRNKKDQ